MLYISSHRKEYILLQVVKTFLVKCQNTRESYICFKYSTSVSFFSGETASVKTSNIIYFLARKEKLFLTAIDFDFPFCILR